MSHDGFVPAATYQIYRKGQTCTTAWPGDFVLVRHSGFVAGAIRFGERLHRPKGVAKDVWQHFTGWNHAAPILGSGPNAMLAQETAKGVVVSHLADYEPLEYAVVHVQSTPEQRDAAVRFVESTVGSGYGYLSIAADAFNSLTGLELSLGWGDRMVCSTTRAMERMGLIPERSPDAVTPAHLAFYFNVPYTPETPK